MFLPLFCHQGNDKDCVFHSKNYLLFSDFFWILLKTPDMETHVHTEIFIEREREVEPGGCSLVLLCCHREVWIFCLLIGESILCLYVWKIVRLLLHQKNLDASACDFWGLMIMANSFNLSKCQFLRKF